MSFKDKMKYFFSIDGKNQAKIAEELGCTRYVVQTRIVNGATLPRILEIVNACDCDIYIKHRKTGIETIITADDFQKKEKAKEKNEEKK